MANKSSPGKTTAASAKDVSIPTEPSPTDRLSAALQAMGYDPRQFVMESREEYVMFPGGGYINRYTNVQLPNGMQENFSTDLMARYPEVTANEIKRILSMPNGNPYTGLV